ncbi:molybdenum cofactor guanylyltransferase [Halobacillus naozhouensis]|uniref:Probable molybdenum cofactor guanylyltransferase n=1 Tax=Halobacillus naozhouensis TaxID=554880 RepID=A0ABY8IV26_9BACI|nr:molybdenum cofactor guanylyltransferase [Halobacillus naozhouensis]WFT73043.1 molybdenum cofactor guanylyltransferase [Halobacillus naozhouensis]
MIEPREICGAVLAGGGSTRMGTDKAVLPLGDQTVLERITNELSHCCDRVVINRDQPFPTTALTIDVVHDTFLDAGPLAGLHAVLKNGSESFVLLSACDTPFIQKEVFHEMFQAFSKEKHAIVPIYENRIQPLSGIYRRSLLPVVERLLQEGQRSMRSLLDQINVQYMSDFRSISEEAAADHFFNMNTQEEYDTARTLLRKYR